MTKVIRNLIKTITYVAVAAVFAGCATTVDSVNESAKIAQSAEVTDKKIVFGKFRLMQNGEEVTLGDSVFANSATLQLYRYETDREIVGKVGKDGDFAWVLEPGQYQLSSIAFKHRGESIEPDTSFAFTVSADHDASYVGTITLEATSDSGYHGTSVMVERFTVSNDCEAECGKVLTALGMTQDAATTSLLHWETQVASNR